MPNIISEDESPAVVYVVPYIGLTPNVISLNVARRKKLLEDLGYHVCLVEAKGSQFFRLVRIIRKYKRNLVGIIIRIDSACRLDKYTLVKLLAPAVPVIWEVHGFPQERLVFSQDIAAYWILWKNTLKRLVLSLLADACIFITPELRSFARGKIYMRKTAIIPNFAQTGIKYTDKSRHVLSSLAKNNYRIVLWGGSGELPWQAVDVIDKTADSVYRQNKQVVFILVGSNYWYPVKSKPNMLLLQPVPPEQFQHLITVSHVCLALYHQPKFFPFYFCPMKILEYMAAGKPVIATGLGMIPRLIQSGHNGFLTSNAVADISAKILLLAKDAALSQKLSRKAQQTISTSFNQAVIQKLYRELFQSLSQPIVNGIL